MNVLIKNHRKIFLISLLIAADIAVFGMMNTNSAPSIMLIVGFLLLSATVYALLSGVFGLVRLYGIKFKHQRRITLVLTAVIGGMAALQSIGQLGPKDIVVALIFAAVYYLYSSYAKNSLNERRQQATSS